jgi:hypothetical protein
MALHAPRPMPLAICCSSSIVVGQKDQDRVVARVRLPPAAIRAGPSDSPDTAATSQRIRLVGFRHHRDAHAVTVAGSFRPDDATLAEASRFRLSEAEATALRVQCLAGGVEARAERRAVALSVRE